VVVGLISVVLFLGSVIVVLVLVGRIAVHAIRGRRDRLAPTARLLAWYVAGYAAVLLGAALLMPRRTLPQGVRECFDDWCVAGVGVGPSALVPPGCDGENIWIGTLEVSSDAKRVRQRAADAAAMLEDQSGRRYRPCGIPASGGIEPHGIRDELGPGDSFQVTLAFSLPADARPIGFVISHGAFPGVLIIGDDQSLGHRPTLLAVAGEGGG
jgi:hypothetical protein